MGGVEYTPPGGITPIGYFALWVPTRFPGFDAAVSWFFFGILGLVAGSARNAIAM